MSDEPPPSAKTKSLEAHFALAELEAERKARAKAEAQLEAERAEAKTQLEALLKKLHSQAAFNLANKWAVAASRASLFKSAEEELLIKSGAQVMHEIPSLTTEHRAALAAALHTLTCPAAGAPEVNAAVAGSAHNILQTVLKVVARELGDTCQLRAFYENELDDSNRPDFIYVERHEAQVTLLSMLLAVEVKSRPVLASKRAALLREGKVQALRYCACRVLALHAACPTTAPWQAFALVTNGEVVCVIRMVYTGTRLTAYMTEDEPLLPRQIPPKPELTPGAELLARVLAASPQQLGSAFVAPPRTAAVDFPLGAPRRLQRPRLLTIADGVALGHGGFCDVFAGTLEGEGDVAVKLARSPKDAATSLQLRREARVLRKLERAASPHVPRLLAHMTMPSGALGLVLSPVGIVATRARGAEAHPCSPERRALAVACADGVLSALRAAHAAGYLHADARPTNVLWRPPPHPTVLSDWGLARSVEPSLQSLQSHALGWLETAPDAALQSELIPGAAWLPSASTDCESALYTLAAIAFGQPCGAAPWAAGVGAGDVAALHAARSAWFARLPAVHPLRAARATVLAWQSDRRDRGDPPPLPYELLPEWATM